MFLSLAVQNDNQVTRTVVGILNGLGRDSESGTQEKRDLVRQVLHLNMLRVWAIAIWQWHCWVTMA